MKFRHAPFFASLVLITALASFGLVGCTAESNSKPTTVATLNSAVQQNDRQPIGGAPASDPSSPVVSKDQKDHTAETPVFSNPFPSDPVRQELYPELSKFLLQMPDTAVQPRGIGEFIDEFLKQPQVTLQTPVLVKGTLLTGFEADFDEKGHYIQKYVPGLSIQDAENAKQTLSFSVPTAVYYYFYDLGLKPGDSVTVLLQGKIQVKDLSLTAAEVGEEKARQVFKLIPAEEGHNFSFVDPAAAKGQS